MKSSERISPWIWIAVAYLFSVALRFIWVAWAQHHPEFFWNDQLMINTNDGYFFAAGAQKELYGLHADNPRVYGMWDYGVIFFTTLLAKFTPLSLETVILYMPTFVSSLVVIPVILIARLYNRTVWGFFAALLGSVAWSYYNRTMTGYYDTDMFSAMAPMFIVYFLMRSTVDFDLKSAWYAALAIVFYPFLYDQGLSLIYAMGIIYGAYMVWYHRREKMAYASMLLVFSALFPYKILGADAPWYYLIGAGAVTAVYLLLRRHMQNVSVSTLRRITAAAFLLFLLAGNVFGLIWTKVTSYLVTGTADEAGLHYFAVNQTVREAGKIPFDIFAKRISGSQIGLVLSLIGYAVLVMRHRAFLLALPLVGIGIFALWGGLRFTVYAVPVAAMGATYLFWLIGEYIVKEKKLRLGFVATATAAMLYPNITHIINYKVPTVLNGSEVKDLTALDKQASSKDYTIAWWDYGYPIWFYSDTSTLIDGGKHNDDNFIVSKILQTDSPALAANLARLAVETYEKNGHKVVTHTLFADADPNDVLAKLEKGTYPLPPKTRDIYLYLPYRMLGIFPTVMKFGNLDLTTGEPLREPIFFPLRIVAGKGGQWQLENGSVLDVQAGILHDGQQKARIRYLITARVRKNGKIDVRGKAYAHQARLVAVMLQSYGQLVLMDAETFNSMYVQMFMLGRYDKRYFEPAVVSPYSRIYRLKK